MLNLSSNMIQKLESTHLEDLISLQILDLSRNAIASVAPATFRDLAHLKYLDLSLNSLRTVRNDFNLFTILEILPSICDFRSKMMHWKD